MIQELDALHPSMIGLPAYDTPKHGVWGFTKNTAAELAPHGIAVNAVAPGGVITPGTVPELAARNDAVPAQADRNTRNWPVGRCTAAPNPAR
jgi:NAD(P)-dependent dehydrogenase (short-subunit alcohol dehydrogenase family)